MLQTIKKILLLTNSEKNILFLFLFLFLFLSIIEAIGLSLIVPYLALVIDNKTTNPMLNSMLVFFDLDMSLLIISYILIMVFFVKTVLVLFVNRKIIAFGQEQKAELSLYLMKSYQNLSYEIFLHKNSSQYIYNIHSLTSQFSNLLVMLLRTTSNAIISFFIILMLLWQDPLVLLFLISIFGIALFGYDVLFKGKVKKYGRRLNESSKLMLKGINEGMSGFKEIRILRKEFFFFNMVRSGVENQVENSVKYQFISTIPRSLLEFLMILFVTILVIGFTLTDQDVQKLVPVLGVFGIAALRLFPFVGSFSNMLIDLRHGHDSISQLSNDISELKKSECNPTCENYSLANINELIFDRVNFHYSGNVENILNNVCLTIKPGQCIGIVGESGSGKTTLIDLLLGLLEPTGGNIKFNNQSTLDSRVLESLRAQVAYIPQDIFLMDDTLKNNIAIDDGGKIIKDKVIQAINQAQLSDVLKSLPDGLDTMLGENGVRMSGGQRQRIALARAFYHNRNIIIMDEATSALDNETEAKIFNEVDLFRKERTVIIITHKIDTLKKCDSIYKIENKAVRRVGNYHDLFHNKS